MRRNQLGLKASNVLLSAIVVALFMYFLVLAMAQDQVLSSLSRAPGFENYSWSLTKARKSDEVADLVDDLERQKQQLSRELAALVSKAAVARLKYGRAVARTNPIRLVMQDSSGCTTTRDTILPEEGLSKLEIAMQKTDAELSSLYVCVVRDQMLDEPQRQAYLRPLAATDQLSDETIGIEASLRVKTQQFETLAKESWRQRKLLEKLEPIRVHFAVLDSLATPRWFPTNFANYPPFIVHVLLSFFSGMFGALLVTMVFVVYPSKLRERVSAKLYYKRVFLGGLVAVTVFIVLTGGASILGTGDTGQVATNVMSFTAIGLLAGMFSDTVADWLSVRAKTMFSTEEDDEGKDEGEDDSPARG
jgi:hypothetical protein